MTRSEEMRQYMMVLEAMHREALRHMPIAIKDTFYAADMDGVKIYLADFGYIFQNGMEFYKKSHESATRNGDHVTVRPCGTGYKFTVVVGYEARK